MEKENYILGLDIGISSVGWGLLALDENNNPYKIIDVGSRIFAPGETEKTGESRAKDRREKRGSRRVTRRRSFRLDRVRNLLYENNYLKGNITSNIVSEKNNELVKLYNNMINNYYKDKDTNPYKLKVEALDRKLTNEELSIILVHYAKKRGYKSNREDKGNDESGKVKTAIKENEELIKKKKYRTISELYITDEKFAKKIKNTTGDYKISVTNEMYLDEINKVLDSQIKFGLITNKFKDEYLSIYNSRRHYSSGPGGDSPYGGNLIEKMTGKCKYDGNYRAPKRAFSSEVFVALTKLINLRYKVDNGEYTKLNEKEIHNLIELAKINKTLNYKHVVKELKLDNVKFKDLTLPKKKYISVIDSLKKKLNISKDDEIDIYNLNNEEKEIYNKLYNDALLSTKLIELEGYHELKDVIVKSFSNEYFDTIKDNYDLLDELALLCTNYKLNEEIKNRIIESNNIPNELADDNFIDNLPNFKDHLMLSTDIIRKLIPLMLKGIRYDEAMNMLNYKDINSVKEKKDLLVPIYVDENIRNQRVMRSLTQTRKVINAIIKKYGMPKVINIETARELAKTQKERNNIEKNNLEKKANNDEIKKHLVELNYFSSVDKINGNDILKYNLWKEQNEFCPYSLEKISLDDIYVNNSVQIDHILPYSRTYNDNYLNKTLVFSKANQDKGNNTPYEWFGKTDKWNKYETYINSLNISSRKKDNYLLKVLDFDTEREMRNQNLNDTKYIARELSSLIKAYLNVEKVNMYQGSITAKLRARWGLNRLTHSYISNNYIMPSEFKKDINKDRDNHLHHAMDALVIASITPSLQKKITLYEQFKSYIDNDTKESISNRYKQLDDDKIIFYDDNGEVLDEVTLDEYLKEEFANNHINFYKHNIARLDFPMPYKDFDNEAKIRVYERDKDMLKDKLRMLNKYSEKELNNIHVLIPSIAKAKISGAMHKDTYYGLKYKNNDDRNEILYRTIRKPIENITIKDLESIPDRNGGSKEIVNSIISWLGKDKNGSDALKRHNGKYPVNTLDKEKKEIKKIKVYEEYKKNGHIVHNTNVEKGNVYKIEVYKSKNKDDDKLYFTALDMYEIKTINEINKGKNIDLEVKLEYGQGDKNIFINYKDISNIYTLQNTFNKNELVEITNKDNKKILSYISGFSTGKLEVKSPVGDGYDLIGNNKIFNNITDRYIITCSTIKEIKKMSISLLGEISELQTSNNKEK